MKKNYSLTFQLFLALLLVGCTHGSTQLKRLQQIDSLMEINPQAAYDSLCQDQKGMEQSGKIKIEMRHRLLMAKAENKLYLQMPSDSLFQEVVDYYESKGSSNDKMEARYLMGCIYRDQKEAPRAMQWYNEAAESADTLSKGCDYTTLFSIYGQMAEIYRYQYLHQKAIACLKNYCRYAALNNDRRNYIQGLAQAASEYYELGDTLQALKLILKSYKLYMKYNMVKEAARVLPTLIYIHLNRAQYQQARHYMNIYEKYSNLFDCNNNINSGYEHYYKAKGMLYLGINQVDSAEYYFRKLSHHKDFTYEASQGLLAVYRIHLNTDSIRKYSCLCEKEMDKILNGTQAKAVIQATSLYNYTKLQKKIDNEKSQKERTKHIILVSSIAILIGIIYVGKRYEDMRKHMSKKLANLSKDYLRTFKNLEKVREELDLLQKDSDSVILKKQKEIVSLQKSLQRYKIQFEQYNLADKKKALMTSDIVNTFKELSKPTKKHNLPQVEDWKELSAIFQQSLPLPFEKIQKGCLSPQEFQVCILTYLGMDNIEISVLTDTTSKVICNAKQKANKKLFNDNSASSLYKNLLNISNF